MTTTAPGAGPQAPRLSTTHLVALAARVVAGLVVWRVGLPDIPVWDTTLDALTAPTALTVGAGVAVVVLGVTSHRAWRVVDMTVAAVVAVAGPPSPRPGRVAEMPVAAVAAVAGGLFLLGMTAAWTPLTPPTGRLYPPLP